MHENNSLSEHLELVEEMNRLFLSFLQGRARRGVECLGLPEPACALLRNATAAQLDRAATLPRALFSIDIEDTAAADGSIEQASSETIALYSLQSKLLLSAKILSRRNAHLAQTFLGLSQAALVKLQCLVLVELVELAETARIVATRFDDEPRFWRELLCSEDQLAQRRLRLIALQPRAADLNLSAGPRAARRR